MSCFNSGLLGIEMDFSYSVGVGLVVCRQNLAPEQAVKTPWGDGGQVVKRVGGKGCCGLVGGWGGGFQGCWGMK